MTRRGPLHAKSIDINGARAWSVSGTPADCVNLAIYNLLDKRPDIVVSGINVGKNVGVSFIFSSGTVGACLEANIAGIPALALSQELQPEDFLHWDRERSFRPQTATLLKSLSDHVIPAIWEDLTLCSKSPPTTWNVNMPYTRSGSPEIIKTRLGHSFYFSCFEKHEGHYRHKFSKTTIDPDSDTDEMVVRSGHVSATEIDIRAFGQAI